MRVWQTTCTLVHARGGAEGIRTESLFQMHRVSLVGAPGSGKTTVGRALATALGARFVELDSIFHQRDWGELPLDEFRERVSEEAIAEAWVIDGNYTRVRELVWARADSVVWLDLPRQLVMRRLIYRTLRRAVTREQLWNDNREPLTNFYRLDPQKNIIRWAWMNHAKYIERYEKAMDDPRYRHLNFMRLRAKQEVDGFLASQIGSGAKR